MFQALAERFDTFGGVLAVAALAGALGGMVLGRFIDMGHARGSVWLNAVILAAGLLLKSICGSDPYAVVGVTIATTLFSGLYFPYWMTAVYNASKIAPCTFRFQFASEGGWDAGGICAMPGRRARMRQQPAARGGHLVGTSDGRRAGAAGRCEPQRA